MTLGEKLARLRKENNLTQEQLAEMMGVSRQTVSKWESNNAYPETGKLVWIGRHFGCSMDYLLNDTMTEPAKQEASCWRSFQYERKSKHLVMGVPLWHINFGVGRTAKGIFAVGLKTRGVVSLGVFSMGVISFGALSAGLLSLGALSLGLLSLGAVTVGILAIGAISIGLFAMGAVAVGKFAVGALSVGKYAAFGDYARASVALGRTSAIGQAFSKIGDLRPAEYQTVIRLLNEKTPVYLSWAKWLFKLFI